MNNLYEVYFSTVFSMSLLLMLTVNFMTLRVLRSYTRKQNVRYANSNVVKARVERRGMIILVSTHHLAKSLSINILSLRRQCHWHFFLPGCQVSLWMHTVSNMLTSWKIYSGSLIPWWVTDLERKIHHSILGSPKSKPSSISSWLLCIYK